MKVKAKDLSTCFWSYAKNARPSTDEQAQLMGAAERLAAKLNISTPAAVRKLAGGAAREESILRQARENPELAPHYGEQMRKNDLDVFGSLEIKAAVLGA
jgi:hypothetical protein